MRSADRIMDSLSSGPATGSVVASPDRSVILVRSFFPATEGVVEPGAHLKMAVCMAGGGQVQYLRGSQSRHWRWRRGDVLLTGLHDKSSFASPDVDMVGLAVDLASLDKMGGEQEVWPNLDNLPSQSLRDELIRSVIVALWSCAEHHGSTSAFIDEGVGLILQRLAELSSGRDCRRASQRACEWSSGTLSRRQLATVSEYIRSRIAHDIRVPELATLLGMERRRFSRALQGSVGCGPYAYLMGLRMQRAKELLESGQSITSIALSVGYANPSKFSAAFRRSVGCTPSQWKSFQA